MCSSYLYWLVCSGCGCVVVTCGSYLYRLVCSGCGYLVVTFCSYLYWLVCTGAHAAGSGHEIDADH